MFNNVRDACLTMFDMGEGVVDCSPIWGGSILLIPPGGFWNWKWRGVYFFGKGERDDAGAA